MDFTRIRLSGFKSFVEPAEFRIEAGLTGVVGPNGCGKSNILEAMRWVMGAASAKAMRGEGMDDVIFAGAAGRPARNHAEVTLTIDNAEGNAPAPFRGEPVLEVSRRIDRGEGSTFRINGREARARDVQLLFADASTGANSPALVRQGQISELIAARPQNRRRILEEAAGVTGLHGRRHEAELRVAAAAANLERLDDLARELESALAKLRREARQAARYKALGAEIRSLQASLLRQRWLEAHAAAERLARGADAARAELEAATRAAGLATTAATEAEGAIRPLRDGEMVAAAALGRLAIDKDRLDRDLDQARADADRLAGELTRLAGDDAREAAWLADAAAALERLDATDADLKAQIAAAPERTPALEAEAKAADAARAEAETRLEALAASLAAAEADHRAAQQRLAEAESRRARTAASLEEARAALEAVPVAGDADGVEADHAAKQSALEAARAALAQAETARGQTHAGEALARMKRRAGEDAMSAAATEAGALERLTASSGEAFPPALDSVRPNAGLEAALAAALGDDLDAALDPKAPAFWRGAVTIAPIWPIGTTPLAELVKAPPQLAARLAHTALVAAADGAKLQAGLPIGARLVSREGDLWRWDGFTRRADAPRPAQARLEQKSRLAVLRRQLETLSPAAEAAKAMHADATAAVEAAETSLRAARAAQSAAEASYSAASRAREARQKESSAREARLAQLSEAVRRLTEDLAQAEADVAARTSEASERAVDPDLTANLQAAREAAARARDQAAATRLAFEAHRREREAREGRLATIASERAGWVARMESTARRREALAATKLSTEAALEIAEAAPGQAEERRLALIDALSTAEARKAKASDALAAAETARSEADRAARAAEERASAAREARAGSEARLEAARERLAEHAQALAEAGGETTSPIGRGRDANEESDRVRGYAAGSETPSTPPGSPSPLGGGEAPAFSPPSGGRAGEAGRGVNATAVASDNYPGEPGAAEARLAALERERDNLGPVNLRAEDEAAELAERVATLAAERADLAGALAKLRQGVGELNAEGRTRLLEAFEVIHGHFRDLFVTLFQGGQAELRLIESDDPLEAGLEILACPPGKRMAVMSLMSGGEQALTAMALIFAVFLANPAPVCVLDEADAPLDDANVERFCDLLAAMRTRASTRFIVISHNALTMSRMDRLYGVTMREPGVSQLVSVDLRQAEAMAANA